MLEQEVASEAEGLVVAFKTDGRLFLVRNLRSYKRSKGGG